LKVRASPVKPGFLESRRLLTLILLAAMAWSLFSVDWNDKLIHAGGLNALLQIAKSLLTPDLSPSFLGLALEATWITLSFAVAGITLAIAIGLPLGVIASGTLSSSRWGRITSVTSIRFVLAFLRSIHELVWAWLFIVAFGLSPIAGVLALAIPYGGILGRIYSEILNDVPQGPLRSLRSAGASEFRVFLYGRLPMALPDMLSYTFYRFECGIRSAAILSFVGITGLGFQIELSLEDLLFDQVWTLLFFMVILILLVDVWSQQVRRRLVA
jgi:phosphonate transport system permease protein